MFDYGLFFFKRNMYICYNMPLLGVSPDFNESSVHSSVKKKKTLRISVHLFREVQHQLSEI